MTNAKKLLVTGANGFVGLALCAEALRRGFSVVGAVRGDSRLPAGVQQTVVGAIDENTNWESALRDVDVIIHLAARVHVMKESATDPLTEFRRVNVAGTEQLARSAANRVKRFVYVSSIKVNGEVTTCGYKFSEQNFPSPQDSYGVAKWEAEQALHRIVKETGMEIVIVRPSLVYGSDVKGNFAQLLSVLWLGLPLPLASVRNKRSLIYIDNLVDALLACATHSAAAGKTYLLSDGEDISTPDLLRQLGSAMGRPARLLSFPMVLLKLGGHLLGKADVLARVLGSLQVDSSKIRRELDWHPPYTMQQGLRVTAEGYREKM